MLSSERASTCSASRAVTSAQNARVISRRRSARAATQILARGLPLRVSRALERVDAATRVEQPLQIEPRPEVVGNVGIDHLPRLSRLHDRELVDVIGPRIASLRGDTRTAIGGASLLERFRRVLPRLELGQTQAVGQALRDRLHPGSVPRTIDRARRTPVPAAAEQYSQTE